MMLTLTAIDKTGEFRQFSCLLGSLEVCLDALSEISAKGGQLLTAELNEQGRRTPLPVDAFDGEVFSVPIQALEVQWQYALSKPLTMPTTSRQRLIGLMRQQIETQKVSVNRLEASHRVIEQRLKQLQTMSSQGTNRTELLLRYELKFTQCQLLLTSALTRQQKDSDRLCTLLNR